MTLREKPITLGYGQGIHHSCPGCLAFVPEDYACPYCAEPSPHDGDLD